MSVDRDDELLTALSQGVRPDPGDPMIEMLADWHADLGTDLPAPARVRRRRWPLRPVAIGFVVGVLALGGTTAMASTAQPGSPLWPLTRAVYPHKAQSRAAEQTATRLLDQAALAIRDRRIDDTAAALNDAAREIALVTDATAHARLAQRWTDLRAALLALYSTGTPSAAPPIAPAPNAGASSAPQPAPSPHPSRSAGGGLLPLPLPTKPLPLPSLPLPPLPSILPSLPPLLP